MTATQQRFHQSFGTGRVRLVREHGQEHSSQWRAIRSVAEKMGCSAEALRNWGRRSQVDDGIDAL